MTRIRMRVWGGALLVVAALVMTVDAGAKGSKSWPQFRGENRDGVGNEKGLKGAWPETGPKEVFRVALGEGYSGVSIVDGHLYTMYSAEIDGEWMEVAAALDAKSGEEKWRVPVSAKFDNEFGNGPRATPTIDGTTVYVLSSVGDLAALKISDGSEIWKVSLTEGFGAKVPTFGFSTSPLIDGDHLVLQTGAPEGQSYAALNKKTGEVIWGFGDTAREAGYTSILNVTLAGKKQYVDIFQGKIRGLDPEGNELWSHDWPQGETHTVPIFIEPDKIFASGAQGVGAALLQVKKNGDGMEVTEVWKNDFMRNHFSSSVYHDGFIYGFDNATLKCISAKDGKMAWAKRGLGKGSLIFADGNLLVLSDRGKLLLVRATPDSYVETGSVQALEGKCWTAPTILDGRLYLRNHEELVSYDLKG